MPEIMKRFAAYLQLSRFVVCLIAALMALEGYWLATHQFALSLKAFFAAIATGAAYGWSNAHNDILDLETDKVNQPERPIPAGQVTLSEATWFTGTLLVTSLLFSFLSSWRMFVLTALLLGVSYLYNRWAKKIPVLGKMIVAALSAMTLTAGYFVTVDGDFPLIPVLVGFLFILAREFIGTVSDARGDKLGGRSSISMLWGKKKVLLTCLVLICIAGLLLILPAFVSNLSSPGMYLATILILSITPVFVGVAAIWRDQSSTNIRRVSFNMRYVLLSSLLSLLWLV